MKLVSLYPNNQRTTPLIEEELKIAIEHGSLLEMCLEIMDVAKTILCWQSGIFIGGSYVCSMPPLAINYCWTTISSLK